MYQGYRLKIDGVVFPNSYIAKGSYSAVDKKRVVETWVDANQVEHEVTTGQAKANIAFSLIEHNSEKHSELMKFFQKDDDIRVEFYNDRTDAYRVANCRLVDISFSHSNTYGGKVQYNSTAINFIEN